jgi:hypothetical protein
MSEKQPSDQKSESSQKSEYLLFLKTVKQNISSYFTNFWFIIEFSSPQETSQWIQMMKTKWISIKDKYPLFSLELYRPDIQLKTKNLQENKTSETPEFKYQVIHTKTERNKLLTPRCECEHNSCDFYLDPMIRFLHNHLLKTPEVIEDAFINIIQSSPNEIKITSTGFVPAIFLTLFADILKARIPLLNITKSSALNSQQIHKIKKSNFAIRLPFEEQEKHINKYLLVPWEMDYRDINTYLTLQLNENLKNDNIGSLFKYDESTILTVEEIEKLSKCYCLYFQSNHIVNIGDERFCVYRNCLNRGPTKNCMKNFIKYCESQWTCFESVQDSGSSEGGFEFSAFCTNECPSSWLFLFFKSILKGYYDNRTDIRGNQSFAKRDRHPVWFLIIFGLWASEYGMKNVNIDVNYSRVYCS